MVKTFFTKEQQRAIETKNKNILVSAAAGSGKTAVLVERIINKVIKDKINIDEIVVVTFTELAAREMKDRIGLKFKELLEIDPNNRHIQKQKNLLPNANISTIHSFCSKLIKNNFNDCDIDPNFKILDEKEVSMLKDNVITAIFTELYENGNDNEIFLELIELYGDKITDDSLKEIILRIYDNAINTPFPEEWLLETLKHYNLNNDNVNNNIWIDNIILECERIFINIINTLNIALDICQNNSGLENYAELLSDDLYKINKLKNSLNEGNFFDLDWNIKFNRFPTQKKGDTKDIDLKNNIKNIRDAYKKDFSSLKKDFSNKTKDAFLEETKNLKIVFNNIINIVKTFKENYTEEKIKLSAVDYNDLEQLTLKLLINNIKGELHPTELALKLKNKYKEILIDEYQDCNHIQETIFKFISNGRNMFMVGDVKQSIYGFRHAKPQLFINKFNTYETFGEEKEKVILARNFRSNKNIINATNFIFEQIMTDKVGGINYNKDISLKKGLIKKLKKKTLNLIKGPSLKKVKENAKLNLLIGDYTLEKSNDNKISKSEFEGIIIANKIFDLINNNCLIYDKKQNVERKVTYKDIVILTRSKKNVKDLGNALKEKGIPYVSSNKGNFFEYLEIQILISYLQILDNQYQDIPLLSILSSPIYSLTSDELVHIKNTNGANFFNKINEYIKINNTNLISSKLKKFIIDYNELKSQSQLITISDLIKSILKISNLETYISTLLNYKTRLGNIKILIQTAKEYEKTNYSTLFNFINYTMQLKSNNIQIDESIVNHENNDVVKILTIHKSKGLEFPIVFLSDLNKKFNRSDEKQKILIHNELGLTSKSLNLKYRIQSNTYQKVITTKKLKSDLIAEELRVLYVAMTRAESQLFLVATTEKLSKDIENVEKLKYISNTKFNSNDILNCNSYYEMILLCFFRHKDWLTNNIINKNNYIYNYNINLKIDVIPLKDIELKNNDNKIVNIDENLKNLLNGVPQNYDFNKSNVYFYKSLKNTKTKNKIMISDLKRRVVSNELDEQLQLKKPSFVENKVNNMNLGIIYHKILENINLKKDNSKDDVAFIIEDLLKKGFMSKEDLNHLNLNYVYNFIKSDLANRIKKSSKVEKENSFVLGITNKDNLNIDLSDNSYVLINGIIDCYFVENNEVVIVDFKSDYIENVEDFINKYSLQLNIYRMAIEKSTTYKVKEMLVYSLRNNTVFKI